MTFTLQLMMTAAVALIAFVGDAMIRMANFRAREKSASAMTAQEIADDHSAHPPPPIFARRTLKGIAKAVLRVLQQI